MTTYDRRLIEDSLPLEIISAQSAREKSIPNINTLHPWWARRPLAAMRAAIFASLIPAPKDDEERAELHRLLEEIVNWDSVKRGNNASVEEARKLVARYFPEAAPKILDPFMGGGSTGLEALRLGADAYGIELNPVAHIIEVCTIVYPQLYGKPKELNYNSDIRTEDVSSQQMSLDLERTDPIVVQNPLATDVRRWGNWVLEHSRSKIGYLYENVEGHAVVAYVWARTAKCPNPMCGSDMPMVNQWWLAKTDRKKIALRPIVNQVEKRLEYELLEGESISFDPDQGTMRRGTIVCPVCGTTPSDTHLKVEGLEGRLGAVLLAVVYESTRGKAYRLPTDSDHLLFTRSEELLSQKITDSPEVLPTDTIPLMSGTFNAPIYGLDEYGKLFNARQALAIITFVEQVKEVYQFILIEQQDMEYARAIATYLALAVDRLAEDNSTLCRWNSSSEKLQGTFGRQALPMVWDYAETNPFGSSVGSWMSLIDLEINAISISAAANGKPANLKLGTATRLPFPDEMFDAIITDPPYYNAVPYADLSDFFYVWLKRSIGDLYQGTFSTPLSPKSAEIVEMSWWDKKRYAHKDRNFYETQMTLAFAEAQRVMRPDGIFVVVFAHKSTAAWETLINSLLSSNLVVSASWPLHTEMRTRLRAMDSGALASSIFIVCRKRVAEDDGFYDDVRREMTIRIKERLDFFWSQGIRGADFFISAIGPAVEVFGRYRAVRKLSGEVVTVATMLDLVQEAVADYTLARVLNGRYKMGTVDTSTRFYVMYRWSYGGEKLLFDDARRLAQALGAEISDLTRSSVLKQSGDSVTMPNANERKKLEHLGEAGRDGTVPAVIDVLHRAVLIWQEGDRRMLAEYLAQHALGREEEVNAVAQALVNVLPQGDRERQMLENYLQGSSDLPNVPQQQRLL